MLYDNAMALVLFTMERKIDANQQCKSFERSFEPLKCKRDGSRLKTLQKLAVGQRRNSRDVVIRLERLDLEMRRKCDAPGLKWVSWPSKRSWFGAWPLVGTVGR